MHESLYKIGPLGLSNLKYKIHLYTSKNIQLYAYLVLSLLSPLLVAATPDWSPTQSREPTQDFIDFPSATPNRITSPAITTSAPSYNAGSQTLLVNTAIFSGNKIFTETQLQTVVADFMGRDLDSGDIEELRYQLTRFYVDQGYINSGAIITGYDADTKSLRIQLQEGILQNIKVKALNGLKADYIAERLRLSGNNPFHMPSLQERFLIMLDNPLIESLHGAIVPGNTPSQAILETEATGSRPYTASLTFDNHGPVSLGEHRALVRGSLRNLTGDGEIINFGFDASDGNRRGSFDVSVPITAQDTKIKASFDRGRVAVKEEPVDLLDVKGDYIAYELGLTHPLIKNLKHSLVLGLSMARKTNKTTLLGMPFSFTQGAVNGTSTVAPVRFSQEWTQRDANYVYSLNSLLSFGLNALDATPTQGPVDAKFITWRLQQQYARQWWQSRLQLVGRMDLQWADSPLPVLEQVAVGGANSVRGYRENTLIRDQIFLTTLELRYALLDSKQQSRYGHLQGAIFSDFAVGWNQGANEETEHLHSVGLGLLWSHKHLGAQLYWGYAIQDPPHYTSTAWQDDGVHLQLQATY